MTKISPSQRIYTRIKFICHELGLDVYEQLPNLDAPYPFVQIGEQFEQLTVTNKDRLFGTTQVTLHVWHNNELQRGTLTDLMDTIKAELWKIQKVDGLTVDVTGTNSQVLVDTSTDSKLLHGIIEIDLDYK